MSHMCQAWRTGEERGEEVEERLSTFGMMWPAFGVAIGRSPQMSQAHPSHMKSKVYEEWSCGRLIHLWLDVACVWGSHRNRPFSHGDYHSTPSDESGSSCQSVSEVTSCPTKMKRSLWGCEWVREWQNIEDLDNSLPPGRKPQLDGWANVG